MRYLERLVYLIIFCGVGMLSLWLQYGLVEEQPVTFDGRERHDPDYYVENFTAVGMGADGARHYILEAERLVHYPDDDTALLDNPHIVQFEPGAAPRHSYSESGWVSSDGNEVLLTGNVKVIQGTSPQGGGGIMTTEKLRILLDRSKRKDKSG